MEAFENTPFYGEKAEIARIPWVLTARLSASLRLRDFSAGNEEPLWEGMHLEPRDGCSALAGSIILSGVAHAQSGQPFIPHTRLREKSRRSYTLSFAYFSHNAEPVTIPPGPANSFGPDPPSPAPDDVPPRHWRFQCSWSSAKFDGKLR